MRKLFSLLTVIFLFFCITGIASATLIWDDEVEKIEYINSNLHVPANNAWFQLELPSWYDPFLVNNFDITLTGYGDNSSSAIDFIISLEDDKSNQKWASGYNVDNYKWFQLKLDIYNKNLAYRYADDESGLYSQTFQIVKTSFYNPSLSVESFDNHEKFWVGYACHFYHDETEVHIEQYPVPEPATMLLLGAGLIGLAGLSRRKLKK